MKEYLCNNLFDFDITKYKNIYASKNEIYYQLLLYYFLHTNNNLLVVYSSLNEATETYNNLRNYIDEVYIFPEDDFISKKAIASSPELLYLRLKLLNSINSPNKKIVLVHYNSFVKKISDYNEYNKNKIVLNVNENIDREKLINKLIEIGYTKQSTVLTTGEFSVRGYVIDIFPLNSSNPFRIEFFDNQIEKICGFNIYTQLSKGFDAVNSIEISPLKEDFGNMTCSIIDYLLNPIVIYDNIEQIYKMENMIKPQIEYMNMQKEVYKLSELIKESDIHINTINNNDNYDLMILAKSIEYYDNKKDKFLNDIITSSGILYTVSDKLIDDCRNKGIKYVHEYLNRSFIYNGRYYYSDNDLIYHKRETSLDLASKIGTKIDSINSINVGDYVVHKKSGIGIYMGLQTLEKDNIKKDYILIQYKGNDKLYLPVEDIEKLYKYSSKEGSKPTINKLNSLEWEKTKLRIKERIKNITEDLLKLYKERNASYVEPFKKDDENQLIFENEFEYEDTIDQKKTSEEIKRDMEKSKPMERLLCGDVGYGKTEVIFRAMFKTVMNNKQVAYLCPTTILSLQQYNSCVERFKNHGVIIELINRNFTEKQIKDKIERLKAGKIDIIIGTHRLLSDDIEFKDLGLFVIDEEHRFGVEQKEKIKKYKNNVHILSVSATPIPRSLQMSLVGIRDLSLLETPPKNRYPVQTYVIEYNDMILREAIIKEMSRNGQTFILYNNIINMDEVLDKYRKLIPEARICYAHGKMNKEEMSNVIYDFENYNYDVLISTTIIENGIDIPNANTIIVLDADRFGLSQLYQIRGRVGRGDKIAYAYLMYKKNILLSETAVKRLDTIKEFTELGSGYKISMRDLAIRGAGDILGSEQAGFIDSVGVDMYLELLNEEVNNKNDIEENDDDKMKILPIDVDTHINEKYSDENSIIIDMHKKISTITDKKSLLTILDEIKDRFGYLDESTKIYCYEKYYEYLLNETKVKVLINDKYKIVFNIKENIYKNINIEKLFVDTTKLTSKFNFNYKNNNIIVNLNKLNLDKHYIYYSTEFLEIIDEMLKS